MTPAESEHPTAPAPGPYRLPVRKRAMHAVRRAHMYCGLFLLPWAILYGVTGFLFNHPTAFADAPMKSFGAGELNDTPFALRPTSAGVAEQVVAALRGYGADARPLTVVEPEKARYTRDFAFATVRTDDQEISVLFDMTSPNGTIRPKPAAPRPPKKPDAPKPFAHGPRLDSTVARFVTEKPLDERVRDTVPMVLDRAGFPKGTVTVTSVPDLTFLATDGATTWRVTYNALAGTVSAAPAESAPPPDELTTRRFLTRMHLAHGFPGSTNTKWFWALIVDAMALVMVFWGASGLFMWWQVKASRKLGLVVLLLSAAAATALGLGMHEVLTPKS
ncbi:MAG: hypothetical protein FJ304_02650 [Planctomycetes bacterium]|nr:hypothetical protein [Planctomycetota bacterium]